MMSNSTYDTLKLWAQIILPAIATFLFTIGQIWHIDILTTYNEQILATLAAIDTLLGVLLKISSNKYYKEIKKE